MSGNDESESYAPVVRVAFGWRAREVERQATVPVEFPDDDMSAEVLENKPAALAYADPQHAFTLPSGRFLAIDQAAGRVYGATTTPHLDALTPDAAVALADSVVRTLAAAGWTRVAGEGRGASAVAAAARYASDGQGRFGVSNVGTWRVPRPATLWAALPPNAPARPGLWDGVEVYVTVRPVRATAPGGGPKFILEVKLSDPLLNSALSAMSEARRARFHGDMQTLRSWDAQPTEALAPAPSSQPTR